MFTETTRHFDIVNELDEVMGRETRQKAHEKGLIHRAVTIFVFNSRGELFMIQRSKDRKLNPSKWQGSASGHVNAGESYEYAAIRELKEELDIEAELKPEFPIQVYSDEQKEHFRLYSCRVDDDLANKIVPWEGEIQQGKFMPIQDIRAMIEKDPGQFRDAFVLMFDRFFANAPA